MPQPVLEALSGAAYYNPGLIVEGSSGTYGGICLSKTMEGQQFVLACSGCKEGKQHFRKCTLNAIRLSLDKLKCLYCRDWKKGDKVLAKTEIAFMGLLQQWGLDEECAMQVAVPWSKGRVDFVYLPEPQKSPQPCIIVQVDGTAHFTKHYGTEVLKSVEKDMGCCCDAFEASARMLRMHHLDLEDADRGLVDWLLEEQSKPRVVLSSAYGSVKLRQGRDLVSYPKVLAAKLGGDVSLETRAWGYYLTANSA